MQEVYTQLNYRNIKFSANTKAYFATVTTEIESVQPTPTMPCHLIQIRASN
jgi:hypothetical protein